MAAAASRAYAEEQSLLPALEAEHLLAVRRFGTGSASARRKSRRTISRDFHHVLGFRPRDHCAFVDRENETAKFDRA